MLAVTTFLTVLAKVKCKIQIKFSRVVNVFLEVYRSVSDLTQLSNSPATGVIAAREYCLDHVAVQVVHQQYSEVLT